MSQVEKDVEAAIDIINSKEVNSKEYRPVKLFTDRSIKTLKICKVKNKRVLTKYISGDEVIDLLSYNNEVSCYSSNRLDEYFLNLKLALFCLKGNGFYRYFFKDYGNGKGLFSKDIYNNVREKLDDKDRKFFDQLFDYKSGYDILNTKLFMCKDYSYKTLVKYIRYLKKSNLRELIENKSVDFKLCIDGEIPIYYGSNTFNFINLSYNIDSMSDKKIKYISSKIDEIFLPLLKEYGKIQAFTSKKKKILDGYKILETRSIDDPNTLKEYCKKEYAYLYRPQITC